MNISLAFSDFPSPGHPFRIYCFLACGYLSNDGSFTRNVKDAKVFPPDDLSSALDYAHDHIFDFLLNDFNARGSLGLLYPDKAANASLSCPDKAASSCLFNPNIDARVYIHLSSIHSSVRLV